MKLKTVCTAILATAVLNAAVVQAQHNFHIVPRDDTNSTSTFGSTNRVRDNSVNSSNASTNSARHGSVSADQRFVNQATQAGLFEIQLGQLAVANSSNADVVAYGQQLINDHSASNNQLATIAANNSF